MEKEINKPMTIAKEEFANSLVNLINGAGLPYFVMEYIFKDLLNQLHNAANRQLQEDTSEYRKYMAAAEAAGIAQRTPAETQHDDEA